MNAEICIPCPQAKTCSMDSSPMSAQEVITGRDISRNNDYFEICWFYRCSAGQLPALNIYRKKRRAGETGIFPFGSKHKPIILNSVSGFTGRYVVVGEHPDLRLSDGDIVTQDGDGQYQQLTHIDISPPRFNLGRFYF